jgi:flagellar protein FliS
MTQGRGVHAYAQTQVSTTNQRQLIVMAYEGVLRFLGEAKEHMAAKAVEPKYRALCKARAILGELAATLNMERGGEIARNLWNLYMFFIRRIGEANLVNDPALIDGILPSIRELRDAWTQMQIPEADTRAQAQNRRVPSAEVSHRVSITG